MVSAFFALILAGPLASQASFSMGTVGTYTALLDRHPWYNGGFGGLLKLTVTSSGSYSGRITRGMHSKAFKGKLRFHEDGITPIGSFAVTRVKPYTPLDGTFSLPVGALGYNRYMPSLARSGTFSALITPQAAIEGSPTHCRGHLLVSAHNAPQAPIHSYLIETF